MAAELKQRYGVESTLIAGGGGIFEITVDNQLLFSKKALGRFPNENEIQTKIDALN